MYGNNQIAVSHLKIYRYISHANTVAQNESPEITKQVLNNAKASKTWKTEKHNQRITVNSLLTLYLCGRQNKSNKHNVGRIRDIMSTIQDLKLPELL